jgi:excisionase family DNA binding protein
MQKPDMTPLVQRRVFDLPPPGPISLIPNEPGAQSPVNPSNTLLGARMPILWTVKDLVQQLQLKPSTVYAWAAQGKIPSLKIHGLLRFRPEEIAQWVESFHHRRPDSVRSGSRHVEHDDITELIARSRREVYSAHHGETITPSPTGKE